MAHLSPTLYTLLTNRNNNVTIVLIQYRNPPEVLSKLIYDKSLKIICQS